MWTPLSLTERAASATDTLSPLAANRMSVEGVNRVGLTLRRSLPVFPHEQTLFEFACQSQTGHFRTHTPR